MGTGPEPILPAIKFYAISTSRFVSGDSASGVKFFIYLEKLLVGGTGLEPVPIVSYLVIKCHIVSYLYGYDGHTLS